MSVFTYQRYKIRIATGSHKTQGLQPGDIVRRQYDDRTGIIYTLMAVLETGIDVIEGKDSPFFVGALLDGDEPLSGELLDFVRMTSLLNSRRSGTLYLTASDDQAPFLDVVDGMTTEQSLCYPVMGGGKADIPDKTKYACLGGECLTTEYRENDMEAGRIFKLTRNNETLPTSHIVGLKQTIEESVGHPERLLVSFKIRASKMMSILLKFGYSDGGRTDAQETIEIGMEWSYLLWVVTVEYPQQYIRSLFIDLTGQLSTEGDWCEVADLNIVRFSSVSTFAAATKVRVGKVCGIIDPVFGMLEGYGAYFQNLYATKNVNIAGTLISGDGQGFASTFYVGKIHKNVVFNSLACGFSRARETEEITPAGIGRTVLLLGDSVLPVQSAGWREAHVGKRYCFSVWVKSEQTGSIGFYQDEHFLQSTEVTAIGEWQRKKVTFFIKSSAAIQMSIGIQDVIPGLCITAPQLESGNIATPYQATDEVLSYVEDYGAWFCKGGVGGTIQNPLLRLNEDGSISSCDGSFVINRDGTGHFADGRFKWTKEAIELRDFTLRWEDMDEVTQEQLKPRSVSLSGGSVFHYPDGSYESVCEPSQITLEATEHNFEGENRCWEFLGVDDQWKDTGCNATVFTLKPDCPAWQQRNVLSLRYTAATGGQAYSASHTVFKQSDGGSAYTVYVDSDHGTVFQSGSLSTQLRACLYKGGIEITDLISDENFYWSRSSGNAEKDAIWNAANHRGRFLEISNDDVSHKAVFNCEVFLPET